MNLHAAVRGVVTAVNADVPGTWHRNTGYTTTPAGVQTPAYTSVQVQLQVQALTGKDLMHLERLNVQGVERAVYMFSNAQGVVRTDQKGGDLLSFAQDRSKPAQVWKVRAVLETWTPDSAGWCKLGVSLQVP